MANFFWDDTESKHKYHLSNWVSLTQRKENGGLGIPDLRDLNLCLLASWGCTRRQKNITVYSLYMAR
jgi:hypothetical protein